MKNVLLVVTVLAIFISSVHAQDTVQVKMGWNIIGSLDAGAVPDVLYTIPDSIITTSFFGYAPGAGYQSEDTLKMGGGYWVKVSQDGLIIFNPLAAAESCGIKQVNYGGVIYNTVKIGNQCWLKENLNIGEIIQGGDTASNNGTVEKYCYDNDSANCAIYGGLYQWKETMQYETTEGVRGICPLGWHVPMYAEFQTLKSAVGDDGNTLKAIGQGTGGGTGTNTSGFSVLLSGFKYGDVGLGYFGSLGSLVYFWSSTEYNATNAYNLNLHFDYSTIDLIYHHTGGYYGFSVRCLED
jgi:uncharacterized protein (TIGR02145 family)